MPTRQTKKGRKMEPAELFQKVKSLVKNGKTQKQIAVELGFKTPFALTSKLVKASQNSGKSIPAFKLPKKDKPPKRVEMVEVKKRGKGEAFGVNVPQEPLSRIGATAGTKLSVKVTKGRIALTGKY